MRKARCLREVQRSTVGRRFQHSRGAGLISAHSGLVGGCSGDSRRSGDGVGGLDRRPVDGGLDGRDAGVGVAVCVDGFGERRGDDTGWRPAKRRGWRIAPGHLQRVMLARRVMLDRLQLALPLACPLPCGANAKQPWPPVPPSVPPSPKPSKPPPSPPLALRAADMDDKARRDRGRNAARSTTRAACRSMQLPTYATRLICCCSALHTGCPVGEVVALTLMAAILGHAGTTASGRRTLVWLAIAAGARGSEGCGSATNCWADAPSVPSRCETSKPPLRIDEGAHWRALRQRSPSRRRCLACSCVTPQRLPADVMCEAASGSCRGTASCNCIASRRPRWRTRLVSFKRRWRTCWCLPASRSNKLKLTSTTEPWYEVP